MNNLNVAMKDAENFIEEIVPESGRDVQLTVFFDVGPMKKRGFQNAAIFDGHLKRLEISHVSFDEPLLVKEFE